MGGIVLAALLVVVAFLLVTWPGEEPLVGQWDIVVGHESGPSVAVVGIGVRDDGTVAVSMEPGSEAFDAASYSIEGTWEFVGVENGVRRYEARFPIGVITQRMELWCPRGADGDFAGAWGISINGEGFEAVLDDAGTLAVSTSAGEPIAGGTWSEGPAAGENQNARTASAVLDYGEGVSVEATCTR